MNSPIVLGNCPPCASLSGSRPVISSRRATRIAKQSESSPESLRASPSVSGGRVLFWFAATVWISFRMVARKDIVVLFPLDWRGDVCCAQDSMESPNPRQSQAELQGLSCRCAGRHGAVANRRISDRGQARLEWQNPERHQIDRSEEYSSVTTFKGAHLLWSVLASISSQLR